MAKILLVEDINGVRSPLRTVLSLAGHSVVEAEDGRIGLERASEQQFDLVVTDIVMPNLDGSEVILSLKRNGAGTPVLAISGGGAWADTVGALALARESADAVLAKPFSRSALLTAVDLLLGRNPG
jgi:DNA-binding response OmpR family regulator